MGRLFLVQLDGRTYSCKYCRSHLALFEELISKSCQVSEMIYFAHACTTKSFHCKNGRAYLFNTVVNVFVGPLEDRMMTTGMHTVADIFCNCCGQIVGWKYEAAHEKSQKYKEGKFILERARMVDGDGRNFLVDTHVVGSDADEI